MTRNHPWIVRSWHTPKVTTNGALPEDRSRTHPGYGIAAVADGVTRHPAPGKPYPAPSPAADAANLFCEAINSYVLDGSSQLLEAFTAANMAIGDLNADLGLRVDGPAHEDLASTVGAAVLVAGGRTSWAYIGDAGVALLRSGGALAEETSDDIEPLRAGFPRPGSIPAPERHLRIRNTYRNHGNQAVPGFGALTGEAAAMRYVRTGSWMHEPSTDVIAVFSDGFRPFLRHAGARRALGQWANRACSDDGWAAELDGIRRHEPHRFEDEATVVTLVRNQLTNEGE